MDWPGFFKAGAFFGDIKPVGNWLAKPAVRGLAAFGRSCAGFALYRPGISLTLSCKHDAV